MGLTGVQLYTAMEVLIAGVCVLGNALAIGALRSTKKLREPTFCFLTSLAAADLLVGGLAIPLAVVVDGRVETSVPVCRLSSCLVILPCMASIMSLLAIAVDRYLRVSAPLRYRRSVTEKHSWLVVALCWAAAVLMSLAALFSWQHPGAPPAPASPPPANSSSSSVCRFMDVISLSYLVYFNFFFCNLLPLAAMALLYGLLFRAIRRSLRAAPSRSGPPGSYLRKERRLAASLSQLLALFALCWLPLHLMNCVARFGGPAVPAAAFHVGILLSHANSAANPVVYASRIPRIRQAYLKLWSRARGRTLSSLPPSSLQSSDTAPGNNVLVDSF